MKEGYLQTKIAEITDKCKKAEQLILMEESKIKLLQDRVGDLKQLIKKLKDIDEFKKLTLKEIKRENTKLIDDHFESLTRKLSRDIDSMMKIKSKKMTETLNYLIEREKEIKKQSESIEEINKKIIYLLEHNNILMMKLVNKGILSDRETTELDRRSSKKADFNK
jgi:hypothetical protein